MMFDPDQLDILVHWIVERETVRLKKERGEPRPWTADPIINEWRFCNVNRCHDRETIWIFKNIIAEHVDSPALWFNLAIARFINWSPTLRQLGYMETWNPELYVNVMQARIDNEDKVYTGAYMIPAGPAGMVKHEYYAKEVFGPLWARRGQIPTAGTCGHWDRFFGDFRCFGDFMRNQIITDMKYTHHLPRAGTSDWTTFILAGPGTQRGLNRLHGIEEIDHKWKQETAQKALILLRNVLNQKAGETIEHLDDLNNLSNCMCEFDKYCRVKFNEGKPRARYVPSLIETT